MSKAEKIYAKMQNHPLNWRMEDVETVARHFGLTANRPGRGGSHVTFRTLSGDKVTIPDHRPVKQVYVKQLLVLIAKLEESK